MGNDTQSPRSRMGGLFASGGALAGLATLLGASCCILPLVLAQVGLGTALASQLSFLAHARPYLLAVTVALVAAAVIASFWKGRRPRPLVLAMLAGALVMIALSEILPHYEGQLIRWIGY